MGPGSDWDPRDGEGFTSQLMSDLIGFGDEFVHLELNWPLFLDVLGIFF